MRMLTSFAKRVFMSFFVSFPKILGFVSGLNRRCRSCGGLVCGASSVARTGRSRDTVCCQPDVRSFPQFARSLHSGQVQWRMVTIILQEGHVFVKGVSPTFHKRMGGRGVCLPLPSPVFLPRGRGPSQTPKFLSPGPPSPWLPALLIENLLLSLLLNTSGHRNRVANHAPSGECPRRSGAGRKARKRTQVPFPGNNKIIRKSSGGSGGLFQESPGVSLPRSQPVPFPGSNRIIKESSGGSGGLFQESPGVSLPPVTASAASGKQ